MIYLKIQAAVFVLTIFLLFIADKETTKKVEHDIGLFRFIIICQFLIGLPLSAIWFIIGG